MARGCRGQQGSEEKVEGRNTVITGRAVEAGSMEACLDRQSKTGTREEIGCKEWCRSVLEWRMGGVISTQRTKGMDQENSRTVVRGLKYEVNISDGA